MKKMDDQLKDMGLKKTLDKSLREEYDKALADPVFKKLTEKLKSSDKLLMKYTSGLEDSSLEFSNCLKCKGLIECKNKIKGYAYMPILKGDKLEFNYLECKYKKDFDKETRYLNNIELVEVPREIKNARMKDIFTKYQERHEAIKWITEFIKNYNENESMKGLYLHGNFGSGKTFLIAALFNEMAKKGVKSAIVYWPEFLRDLKASFARKNEFNLKFNKIKKTKLLLIDDIGAENTTDWARDEILGPILQYRMQEGLPTFITSNLDLKALTQHFSVTKEKVSEVKASRVVERIKQLTDSVKMVSVNLRK